MGAFINSFPSPGRIFIYFGVVLVSDVFFFLNFHLTLLLYGYFCAG